MERATKALKRGSIRLKSYSEINLILSDLDGMRSHGKSGVKAHQMFVEDLIKWAHREPHEGLKNLFALLTELNVLWTDIHNEYFENLKKFKNQFELILESEQNVDKAKMNLQECERNEAKMRKRLSDSYANSVEERVNTEEKLKAARRALDFAKLEVTEKISENEIIKLIRVKEGLKKLTDSYISLSQKCNVVLQAQKAIVNELPDEIGVNHETQFASDCKAKQALARAKTVIQALGCSANMVEACAPSEYEAPPPYSPFFNLPNTSNNRRSLRNMPSTSAAATNPPETSALSSTRWSQQNNGMLIFNGGCSTEPKTYVCCKCSSQMMTDHRYVQVHDNTTSLESQLATSLQNARIS